jgi:hypothetical protein
MGARMRSLLVWTVSSWAASAAFWACFGACVVAEPPRGEPQARVIASWDPTACGAPHRVAIELADESGAARSASVPCAVGAVELDGVAYGSYRGRIYAWALGEDARSVAPLALDIDDRVVRMTVDTPR